uniref:hypothetical protein n=1 Tax=uncultured Algibacter sp. TaxID=298659 RepID=UPI0026304F0A
TLKCYRISASLKQNNKATQTIYVKVTQHLKTVTKNNLELNLKEATSTLLEMAKNSCWNKISDNTSYIISEIINDERNFFDKRIERKKVNDKKKTKSLEQITAELKDIYVNLYDINLYVYKSEKESTIIEIQYYPKSSLESDFYETVKNNEPMLHCKIVQPPYIAKPPNSVEKERKFDVNWELGGIRYEWNKFLGIIRFKIWKFKYDQRQKLRNKNVG